MANRIKRIHYGPEGRETSLYWKVRVSDAKEPVVINGNVMHALRGHPGVTIGCGLSNMAFDKSNASAFPHPVYLASFTKSAALIVDKLKKDGSPAHAVRYAHSYGWVTDKNDDRTLRKLARENPALVERSFRLRPPRKSPPSGATSGKTSPAKRGTTDRAKAFVPRGALARAVKAGRIGKHVAEQLSNVAVV